MILATCVLGLHLATYHFDRGAGKEEFNPGAYATCPLEGDSSWSAGVYANSDQTKGGWNTFNGEACFECTRKPERIERDRRVAAWAAFNHEIGSIRLSAGLAIGYRGISVRPVAGVSYKTSIGARLTLLPHKRGGLHLSWEFE